MSVNNDRLRKEEAAYDVVRELREKVLAPLNAIMSYSTFGFPLPKDLFGQYPMKLASQNEYSGVFHLITEEVFTGTILKYYLTLNIPLLLRRQLYRGGKVPPLSDLISEIMTLYPLVVDAINNFSVFQILGSYFGEEALFSKRDLMLAKGIYISGLGEEPPLSLKYYLDKKIIYPLTSNLFSGGFR